MVQWLCKHLLGIAVFEAPLANFQTKLSKLSVFSNHFQSVYQDRNLYISVKALLVSFGLGITVEPTPSCRFRRFVDIYQEVAGSKESRKFRTISVSISGTDALFVQAVVNFPIIRIECYTYVVAEEPTRFQIEYLGIQLGCREFWLRSDKRTTQDKTWLFAV